MAPSGCGYPRLWAPIYVNHPLGPTVQQLWATSRERAPAGGPPVGLRPTRNGLFVVKIITIALEACWSRWDGRIAGIQEVGFIGGVGRDLPSSLELRSTARQLVRSFKP